MSANFFNEPPPQNQPPLNPDGTINPVWFLWFYNLFQSSSALVDLQILESFDGGLSDQSLSAAERAEVMQAATIEGGAPPFRGNVEAALLDQPRDWRKPIQDGAVLVWTAAGDPKRTVYIGTAAMRATTPAVFGAVYFETDTQFLYVAVAGIWVVIIGSSTPPGAWTSWTPATTPGGGMTYTGLTKHAYYQQIGKTVNVRLYIDGTIGGAPANTMTITLPVLQRDDFQTLAAAIDNAGVFTAGSVWPVGALGFNVYLPASALYAAGTTRFVVQGAYEAA